MDHNLVSRANVAFLGGTAALLSIMGVKYYMIDK